MLVARRDPPLHSGEYDGSRMRGHGHSRFMTAVQVISTLVAIPVGLASVYSIYRSNFTAEARCESLRGNIVSMLDKSTDASTLRMLVRRDVVTFETNCGAVDPDAVKAFKALLAAKAAPKIAPMAAPAEPPKQVVHEPVQKPVEMAKPAAPPKAAPVAPVVEAKPAEIKSAEPKPVRRDAESSDANWINSVREALTHAPAEQEQAAKAQPETPTQPVQMNVQPSPAPAVVQPSLPPAQARVVPEAPATPPLSLAPPVAPALPEPVPVAAAPAPTSAANHPVPPGSIPDAQPSAQPSVQSLAKPAEPASGHSWLAKIPLVNRIVGD